LSGILAGMSLDLSPRMNQHLRNRRSESGFKKQRKQHVQMFTDFLTITISRNNQQIDHLRSELRAGSKTDCSFENTQALFAIDFAEHWRSREVYRVSGNALS
jgi:hypothetical protein